jgi:hypothetical protein
MVEIVDRACHKEWILASGYKKLDVRLFNMQTYTVAERSGR